MIVQYVAVSSSGHCPKWQALQPVPFTIYSFTRHFLQIQHHCNSCCMRYSLALQDLLHTDSGVEIL